MTTTKKKELTRDLAHKMIGGVAAGIASYFELDPNVIRFLFVVLTIFGGSGVLLYIILWIILPSSSVTQVDGQETLKQNVKEIKDTVQEFAKEFKSTTPAHISEQKSKSSQYYLGLFIVAIGGLFLLVNLGMLDMYVIKKFWPVLLIFLGLYVVSQNE